MTEHDKAAYRQAARLTCRGVSANQVMKRLDAGFQTAKCDAVREGIKDMRTFMTMREIYETEVSPT